MLNDRYIRFLIRKQQQEPLTEEEQQLLDAWYQSLDGLPADDLSESALSQMKEQSWEKLMAPPAKVRRLRWPMVAAAACVLVIGLAFFLKKEVKAPPQTVAQSWVTIDCPQGKRMKVSMPDGSAIWLNGGARLEYDNNFTKNRQCRLTQGEAFFDVKQDATHPFTVNTSSLSIKVLGTSFNVSAYGQLKQEKITVTSGKVRVLDMVLTTNEEVVYNTISKEYVKQTANAQHTDSWRNGECYLTNVSLAELAIRLEQIYGYKVVFSNEKLKQCVNSLRFSEREPVTKVLDLLKLINKVQYRIHGKEITLLGSGC